MTDVFLGFLGLGMGMGLGELLRVYMREESGCVTRICLVLWEWGAESEEKL